MTRCTGTKCILLKWEYKISWNKILIIKVGIQEVLKQNTYHHCGNTRRTETKYLLLKWEYKMYWNKTHNTKHISGNTSPYQSWPFNFWLISSPYADISRCYWCEVYPIDDIKRSTSIEKSPAHCNATQSWKIQRFALLQKVEIDNSGMLLHSI